MSIRLTLSPPVLVVHLRGALLGRMLEEQLREVFQGTFDEGLRHVVIDLQEVTSLDAQTIGLLVEHLVRVRKAGGDLCLAGLGRTVRSAFLFTRLLPAVLETYPSVQEARTVMEAQAAAVTTPPEAP